MQHYIPRIILVGILLQSLFCLRAYTFTQASTGYTIHGKLKGLHDNTAVYLVKNSNQRRGLDTVAMTYTKGDSFFFRGRVGVEEEGAPYFIFIDTLDSRYSSLKKKYLLIHIENKNITISGSIKDMNPLAVHIEGSESQKDLLSYLNDEKKKWISEVRFEVISSARDELKRLLQEDSTIAGKNIMYSANKLDSIIRLNLLKMRNRNTLNWVSAHPNSLISPLILSRLQTPEARKQWDTTFAGLSNRVKGSYFGLIVKKQMERDASLAVGSTAPQLNLPTPQGKLLSLHSIARQNTLTLVDFWAYWCAPCRENFSHLKKLYEVYQDKGFAIYGVSTDTDTVKWKAALQKDRLPWHNVILQREGMAKDLYGVEVLPTVFLLDKEGRVVSRWIGKNEELENILEQLLE